MVEGRGHAWWLDDGIVRRLNAEWACWAEDPAARRSCLRWAAAAPVLSDTWTLGQVLGLVAQAPDEVLGALVGAARTGDMVAARVVLQTMLGKLVRMALVDPYAGVDDYVAVLWCTVMSYPLVSRPRSIAANLALDTLKAVQRERRPSGDEAAAPEVVNEDADLRPAALVAFGREAPADLTAVRVIAAAEHRRLVDAETGALLHSVYAEGLSGRAAADRHCTSPAAVRVRCSRALRSLADHAPLLAEAA